MKIAFQRKSTIVLPKPEGVITIKNYQLARIYRKKLYDLLEKQAKLRGKKYTPKLKFYRGVDTSTYFIGPGH